jgi:tetratricopeptide (TPR) repeat protein
MLGTALLILTWIVYGQTLHHAFVDYDDPTYVTENFQIRRGLTWGGIYWAFTQFHSSNWHPLTSISHMLDVQCFGLNPSAHHAVNLFLHATNSLLCFVILWQLTGAIWRSAVVAAFFAVHPLHVESVAWISERKDVLSGLFFLLTLGAYTWYARGPSLSKYAVVFLTLTAGLLCKPTLVTVPFVLLLLDFWPLQRSRQWPRLVIEKLPLLILSLGAAAATICAQQSTILPFERLSVGFRLVSAIRGYVIYLWQLVWPHDLSVLYPLAPLVSPITTAFLGVGLLGGITLAALLLARTRPYFPVGWLWFIGMLTPMIGLVQVGVQGHADRYTYLPSIGLFITFVWLFAEVATYAPVTRHFVRAALAITIILWTVGARSQAQVWRDSETLWRHALSVTTNNDIAETHLGTVLARDGRLTEGLQHLTRAVHLNPRSAEIEHNLGTAMAKAGQTEIAIEHYRNALRLDPEHEETYYNLGNALLKTGADTEEVIAQYRHAIALREDYPPAHNNLANLLKKKGQVKDALAHYEKAVRIDPTFAEAHVNLGVLLLSENRLKDAISHLKEAVRLRPDIQTAREHLQRALSKEP